jgi:hypothetical protein
MSHRKTSQLKADHLYSFDLVFPKCPVVKGWMLKIAEQKQNRKDQEERTGEPQKRHASANGENSLLLYFG